VVFVDDLNMPQRERYFAQPPLELLRQWFDHGGWYDRKPPCAFKNIIDTQFVGAMGPPGGGRNPVSARLLRHFNFISFTELSDDSLQRIFGTILGAFFRKHFVEAIGGLTQKVRGSQHSCGNFHMAQLVCMNSPMPYCKRSVCLHPKRDSQGYLVTCRGFKKYGVCCAEVCCAAGPCSWCLALWSCTTPSAQSCCPRPARATTPLTCVT
jgi:hypothetical protein